MSDENGGKSRRQFMREGSAAVGGIIAPWDGSKRQRNENFGDDEADDSPTRYAFECWRRTGDGEYRSQGGTLERTVWHIMGDHNPDAAKFIRRGEMGFQDQAIIPEDKIDELPAPAKAVANGEEIPLERVLSKCNYDSLDELWLEVKQKTEPSGIYEGPWLDRESTSEYGAQITFEKMYSGPEVDSMLVVQTTLYRGTFAEFHRMGSIVYGFFDAPPEEILPVETYEAVRLNDGIGTEILDEEAAMFYELLSSTVGEVIAPED